MCERESSAREINIGGREEEREWEGVSESAVGREKERAMRRVRGANGRTIMEQS